MRESVGENARLGERQGGRRGARRRAEKACGARGCASRNARKPCVCARDNSGLNKISRTV